ncbi:MAG: flagellar biosynthesis anti-sigma factor FlgM [Bdellovibrionota bacterium]
MSITKIELNAIASKLEISKEVSHSDEVNNVASVEKGTQVQETTLSRIEFSDNAKILMEAVEAVKNAPDVRLDRVAELKAAIAGGTYKVDSVALADKMLRTHLAEQ